MPSQSWSKYPLKQSYGGSLIWHNTILKKKLLRYINLTFPIVATSVTDIQTKLCAQWGRKDWRCILRAATTSASPISTSAYRCQRGGGFPFVRSRYENVIYIFLGHTSYLQSGRSHIGVGPLVTRICVHLPPYQRVRPLCGEVWMLVRSSFRLGWLYLGSKFHQSCLVNILKPVYLIKETR